MDNYVCAIGGINADIKGISAGLTEDSHPGKIIITSGGVARNVSENLARLGIGVFLLGCAGDDEMGRTVLESTADTGVRTDKVLVQNKIRTGVYLCVSDESGKLNYAVNDMKDALSMTDESYVKANIGTINGSSLIFADANLDSGVLNLIIDTANRKDIPVFIDTVSAAKAVKIKELKGNIDYLSVNSQEFESVLELTDKKNNYADAIRDGIKNIILRKGAEGALLISGRDILRAEAGHAEVVEPNGAGDAFNAGFIYALMNGNAIDKALEYGVAASRFALESETSAGKNLTADNLEKTLRA